MIRTSVWMFRHAESVSNAGGRTEHPATIPLTERGRQQAAVLAQSLEDIPDAIITSPFLRTSQTAEPMAARFESAGTGIWAIQEFTYLAPDRCLNTSWVERKPLIDAYWSRMDPHHVDGPGAESFGNLMDRAKAFLRQAGRDANGLTVIVSHGQFMQAVRLAIEAPELSLADTMLAFHARQAVSPFANCERLRLEIAGRFIQDAERG
jgi:2,3-bisphosphoglycerate-dependent phosphoglycerate mutase